MATSTRNGKHQASGCWIRPAKRHAIYLRDGMRCVYCGCDLHDAHPQDITLDHIICRADGGSHDASNLVTCCRTCNCSRQDKPLRTWASAAVRADVRRLTRRSLDRYLRLAKALADGKCGSESN